MKKKYNLEELKNLDFSIKKPYIIFLKGDLGAGKTTISKHILNNLLGIKENITSPTYTYYNKYDDNYHFDLYRINNYDEFFAIGGEDIFDNNSGVIIVEWPDFIEKYYKPDLLINISKTEKEDQRELEMIYN